MSKYLPVYVVDPAKVETTLWAVHDGKDDLARRPGFRITTGVRIVTVGGRKWLETAAGYRYALDYLRLETPAPPPPPATLTFPLKDWDGPAGRTLVQGVKWDGENFVAANADDVAGQAEQDVVAHLHGPDLGYVGSETYPEAGHGSSFGLQPATEGLRFWIGHNVKGVGFYVYGGGSKFRPVKGVPNGDVSTDPDNDLLCVRAGSRYRGYALSSILAGSPTQIFDSSIPDWGNRFQGHVVVKLSDGNIAVIVHRDMKTLGESRADWFTVTPGAKLIKAGTLNTTRMGDEAEGFLIYDGFVYVTKRVGGSGPGRTIVATRTQLTTWR